MSRHTFVSILGYGDALISLQMLEQVRGQLPGLRIAGTPVTEEIARGVTGGDWDLIRVLPDHAAFFRVRAATPGEIWRDLRQFRAWTRAALAEDEVLLFEKPDWRNRLIVGARRARCLAPATTDSIYADRAAMLSTVAGKPIVMPDCTAPATPVRSVMINPAARYAFKEIPADALTNLLDLFEGIGASVTLIDPARRHGALRSRVRGYHEQPPLSEARARLAEHDLYVGPDSFFVHLAYYLRKPFFTLLPGENADFYFAPPGARRLGNFALLEQARDPAKLAAALKPFLTAGAGRPAGEP